MESKEAMPSSRTQSPMITGGAVLGLVYKDGVMVIADVLGSYGSMARFENLRRVRPVGSNMLFGAGGEYSDLEAIDDMLKQEVHRDFVEDDGHKLTPKQVHSFLARVMHHQRSRVDPLYCQVVTAGFHDGKPHLGYVDLYGSNFTENIIATGFGAYVALPLLRKHWHPEMSEAEARLLLEQCITVCFYRYTLSINRYTLGKVTAAGVEISAPYELKTKWDYKLFINPDASHDGH